MSYFNITILGCGSATPSTRHNPSAQAVRYRNKLMLVDCAEGTQLQMRRYGLSFAKVSDIFISHLHGDHFLGLPGLLSTMSLHNVEGTVTVHTFAEGADILKRLMNLFCRDHSFNIEYDIIDPENPGVVYEDGNITVTAFPLYHRVPCVGFRIHGWSKAPTPPAHTPTAPIPPSTPASPMLSEAATCSSTKPHTATTAPTKRPREDTPQHATQDVLQLWQARAGL